MQPIGLLRHLPEPPLPGLDADTVDASSEAYEKLCTGDAFIGFASYGVTMLLAAMGGERRAHERPWLPLALVLKIAFDNWQAGRLTVHQWTRHRAFCFWCLVAAGASFAMTPFAVAEAREAVRTLGEARFHLRHTGS